MIVDLNEMKTYLRVDYAEEDTLIESLIGSAQKLCMDVARAEDTDQFSQMANAKVAVLYTVAYLFEHREEANHHELTLTLRSLLFGSRKEAF